MAQHTTITVNGMSIDIPKIPSGDADNDRAIHSALIEVVQQIVTHVGSTLKSTLGNYMKSHALGAAGCAMATTKTKAKTAASIPVLGNGELYTLAATDNYWTLSPATVLAVSKYRGYLLCTDDDASTASVFHTVDSAAPITGAQWLAALSGQLPAGVSVVGYLQVATDASHTFTPGTTNLDAAGITATFGDGMPQALLQAITVF